MYVRAIHDNVRATLAIKSDESVEPLRIHLQTGEPSKKAGRKVSNICSGSRELAMTRFPASASVRDIDSYLETGVFGKKKKKEKDKTHIH